jgi:hemolysin-activating ACP:hemolysin acyltransferase
MITFDDMLGQVGAFQDRHARRSLATGLAIRFIEKKWGAKHAASHLPRLLAAIDADQFVFCFDAQARAVAFVSWASVDATAMDRMIESGPSALTRREWASGDNLWIMDFYVHTGMLPLVLMHLRDHILHAYPSVAYFRYRGGYRIAKQLTRANLRGFFGEDNMLTHPPLEMRITDFDVLRGRLESFIQCHRVGQIMRALALAERASRDRARSSHFVHGIATMQQFRVYEGHDGCPNGMLMWAWLSDYTIARIGLAPLHDVHVSEWNEGETLCFFEVAISASCRRDVMADVSGRLFPQERYLLLYTAQGGMAPAGFVRLDRQCTGDEIDRWVALATKGARKLPGSRAPEGASTLHTTSAGAPNVQE